MFKKKIKANQLLNATIHTTPWPQKTASPLAVCKPHEDGDGASTALLEGPEGKPRAKESPR